MIAKLKAAALAALLAFCGVASAQFTQNTGYFAAGGGSGSGGVTVGSVIDGSCTSGYLLYNNAGVIGCLQPVTTTGTPAAGDLPYYDSASSQALLTAASGSTGAYIRSAGTGAAPIWSTLILPNAMTSGGVLYGSAANTVASSGALTANAFITGGGAGAAPNSVALTGLVQGNGASAPTAITNSSTAGQVLRVTGASTYAWGALDLADTDAVTGTLAVANGGTGGATAQAAAQALGTSFNVYAQGMPMYYMATGTMTVGGVMGGFGTLTGSLTPSRALCYFPANAVNSGGSAAGWYFCSFSSTTAGQVEDITPYTPSSTPPVWPSSPTLPTAGANWTSSTATVTAITFDVPANAMGVNGVLEMLNTGFLQTNNANGKSVTMTFGGTTVVNALNLASIGGGFSSWTVRNEGSQSLQITHSELLSRALNAMVQSAVATSSAVTVVISLTKATATDNVAIMGIKARVSQ